MQIVLNLHSQKELSSVLGKEADFSTPGAALELLASSAFFQTPQTVPKRRLKLRGKVLLVIQKG